MVLMVVELRVMQNFIKLNAVVYGFLVNKETDNRTTLPLAVINPQC